MPITIDVPPLGFLIFGVITVISGLTNPYLLNDGDGGEPSAAEKEKYKATPRRRLAVVAVGLGFVLVGVIQMLKGL